MTLSADPGSAAATAAVFGKPAATTTVSLQEKKLTVIAGGSPLREVLQQISGQTGLQVTGNVSAEPTFGTYGPADLDDIVLELLEGLPVNVMLVHAGGGPTLSLTARTGGVTPPRPSGALSSDTDDDSPRRVFAAPVQPTPSPQPALQGQPVPDPRATTAPVDNALPESPNGVRTPSEIFQQLQRLRQSSPPTPPPPAEPQLPPVPVPAPD